VVGQLNVSGDGGGTASQLSLSSVYNETANSAAGTIYVKGATPRDSSGFIKIYVNGNARYVPYFTTITG
jgi:hypothetical protein